MNKLLKDKFIKKIVERWENSEHMQKYCISQLSNGVELQNGYLVEFEKPTIKKDFCFGYGQNGITDEESENNAKDMTNYAASSQEYFIKENIERVFENIEERLNSGEPLFIVPYNKSGYFDFDCIRTKDYMIRYAHQYEKDNSVQLTETDIKNLRAVLKEEKEKFLKRLNSYLKKYGLSKVRSWSYLSD